jgi:sulfite reductase (NADPH) hemoprotein beta-component
MHGIQTSGNCIRNITSDALAGIAADESCRPAPVCEILRQWSTLHPEFAFLPRKFKIAITGAPKTAPPPLARRGPALVKNDAGRAGLQGARGRRHGPHAGDRHRCSASSCPGTRS